MDIKNVQTEAKSEMFSCECLYQIKLLAQYRLQHIRPFLCYIMGWRHPCCVITQICYSKPNLAPMPYYKLNVNYPANSGRFAVVMPLFMILTDIQVQAIHGDFTSHHVDLGAPSLYSSLQCHDTPLANLNHG